MQLVEMACDLGATQSMLMLCKSMPPFAHEPVILAQKREPSKDVIEHVRLHFGCKGGGDNTPRKVKWALPSHLSSIEPGRPNVASALAGIHNSNIAGRHAPGIVLPPFITSFRNSQR
jgi:hypothetical protein